ncbi:MAG: helix-turn-helix domain-containing protein [Actinomycetota bacterium]|nr:helix-turn-helix domain-containing protein [Actinomycetota bacterium]
MRRVRDRIDREYAQPLDVEALARAYLMTRRIERAMALLRRGDLSVTEVCFAVGCSSLGTFSSRFTELVGALSPRSLGLSLWEGGGVGARSGARADLASRRTRAASPIALQS